MEPVLVAAALTTLGGVATACLKVAMLKVRLHSETEIARVAHQALNDRVRLLHPGSTLEESFLGHRIKTSHGAKESSVLQDAAGWVQAEKVVRSCDGMLGWLPKYDVDAPAERLE
ncbi:hypothetical protein [Kitasatospora sp. NPDC088346]|uniref:hypothetical protein n=1 Tax=Kitasatospora sp. NPDC088346 TaxID=3364073 RepID=UPI00380877BA